MGKQQRRQRKRHRKTRQWGGVIPLLAMAIPALSAIGKAAALAAASSLAGHAVRKTNGSQTKKNKQTKGIKQADLSFRIISIWYVDEMEDATDSIAEFVADVAEEVVGVVLEEVATEDLTF